MNLTSERVSDSIASNSSSSFSSSSPQRFLTRQGNTSLELQIFRSSIIIYLQDRKKTVYKQKVCLNTLNRSDKIQISLLSSNRKSTNHGAGWMSMQKKQRVIYPNSFYTLDRHLSYAIHQYFRTGVQHHFYSSYRDHDPPVLPQRFSVQ